MPGPSSKSKGGNDAVKAEYDRLAADYDRRWAFYVKESVRGTIERFKLPPHGSLLDVCCGTGALLQRVASLFPSADLTGIDLSAEMLRVAGDKLGSRAALRVADAGALPFEADRYDVVVSVSSLHYWPDPRKCLAEIARVLKPGGQLVITDWCDDFITCRVCDLFLRAFNRAHVRTYGKRECEGLLRSAGFDDVSIERYRINWLWGLMTAVADNPRRS